MMGGGGTQGNQPPQSHMMSPHMQHMHMQNPYMNIPPQVRERRRGGGEGKEGRREGGYYCGRKRKGAQQ